MTISASVEIAASAEHVWDAALDWPRQGRWMPLTTVVVVDGDGRGVGTRVSARTGVGKLAAVDPMIVDVWEPPALCEVRHEGRIVRGRGVFRVEPLAADRCRFTWEEQLPAGWYGALARVAAPVNRAMFRVAVRRLARWVEAGQP